MSKKDYTVNEKLPNGVTIENVLNREGDVLPFGYYNPETEGKLIWMCNNGIDGKEIVSVFYMKASPPEEEHRDVKYLSSMKDAIYMKEELIKNGWLPLKLPEIKISFSSEKNKK